MNDHKIKIEVDGNACIGIASCTAILSEVFKISDDGRAVLVKGPYLSDYPNITLDQLLNATRSCPTMAIKITDETDNKVLYPL